MDVGALVSAFADARLGQMQLAIAARMLRMNAEAAGSAVKLIDAAEQNTNRLAAVAEGIGENLDISV